MGSHTLSLTGFIVYVIFLMSALRLARRTAPAVLAVGCAVGTYGVLICAAAFTVTFRFWPVSAFYWFFVIAFLMVFGAVYKSISLRILSELFDRPHHSEHYDAIRKRYIERSSFTERTRILRSLGWADENGERLVLTEKGLRIARGVRAVQLLFGMDRSG